MKKIIRKILREQFGYKQQLFDLLRTGDEDNIEMVKMISQGQGIDVIELLIDYFKENPKSPYFKVLNHFDLTEEELIYVLSGIFVVPVRIQIYHELIHTIYNDKNGNIIYSETSDGYWEKNKYDENGNDIYWENSNGEWKKWEYDENGKLTYEEDSDGNIWYSR